MTIPQGTATAAGVLVALWVAGVATHFLMGGMIHVLLIVGVVLAVAAGLQIVDDRRHALVSLGKEQAP